MKLILALASLILISGCTQRSKAQDQGASDAIAGLESMSMLVAGLVPSKAELAEMIRDAAIKNVEAARGKEREKLPPPQETPKQILADPEQYAENAEETREAALSGGIWAWVAGGVLVVLGVLRQVPGAHQPIVALAQKIFENRQDRDLRAEQSSLASAAEVFIEAIELTPNTGTVGDVKERISKMLPAGAGDAVKARLRQMRKETTRGG